MFKKHKALDGSKFRASGLVERKDGWKVRGSKQTVFGGETPRPSTSPKLQTESWMCRFDFSIAPLASVPLMFKKHKAPGVYPPMSITDEQDARLTLILGALEPEIQNMKEVPAKFVTEQCARHKTYGTEIFMSPKQFAWLERLYVEYIGDEEEQPKGADGRRDDMDDEVPF